LKAADVRPVLAANDKRKIPYAHNTQILPQYPDPAPLENVAPV